MPMYFPLVSVFLQKCVSAFRPYYDISMVPAGGGGAEAESMLALAGSGDANLPTPSDLTHFHLPMHVLLILLMFSVVFEQSADNRRAHIRHLCRKTLSTAATDV